jgi:rhodanese-related sulfurtransferase
MKITKSKGFVLVFTIFIFLTVFIPISIPPVNAQSYTSITVQTAYDMISNKTQYPNLVILDVREQWEYDKNHLCNSTLIPLSEINTRISELEPYNDTEIIVYCRSGSRSAQASQNLADNHNFAKIYNMLGGIIAWIAAGYEVCNGLPQPTVGFFVESFLIILIIAIFVFLSVKSSKLEKK